MTLTLPRSEQREAQLAEKRRRQEQERKEHEAEMRQLMDILHRLVAEKSSVKPSLTTEPLRLTKLTEQDDIEAYLLTFERVMEAYGVDKAKWTFQLAPQLTGKAQQAPAALDMVNSSNYASLKEAILRRYHISEETYRRQFRAATLKKGETPRELVTRLTDLARKWSKECSTTEELLDLVVREQLLNSLPEDARTWVRERKAKSSAEAGELAEDFFQAHTTEGHSNTSRERKLPPTDCPRCGGPGYWASDSPKNTTRRDNKPAERGKRQQEVQCFNCKEKGCPTSAQRPP